jgi:hypothetical protein
MAKENFFTRHPLLLATVVFIFWQFPQWFSSVWSLFNTKPFPQWRDEHGWPNMSLQGWTYADWAVNSIVIFLYCAILYFTLRVRQGTQQAKLEASRVREENDSLAQQLVEARQAVPHPEPHFTFDNIKKEVIWKDDDTLTMTATGTVSAFPPLCLGDIYIELSGQGRFREQIQGDWWAEDKLVFDGEIPFTVDIPSYFSCGAYRANLLCRDRDSGEERPSNIFRVDIPLRPAKE